MPDDLEDRPGAKPGKTAVFVVVKQELRPVSEEDLADIIDDGTDRLVDNGLKAKALAEAGAEIERLSGEIEKTIASQARAKAKVAEQAEAIEQDRAGARAAATEAADTIRALRSQVSALEKAIADATAEPESLDG